MHYVSGIGSDPKASPRLEFVLLSVIFLFPRQDFSLVRPYPAGPLPNAAWRLCSLW